MALDPEQIETVREIIYSNSYDATAALLSGLNAAQETATVADIATWNTIRNKHTRISKVEAIGVSTDKDRDRLALTNRVRLRLGLSSLASLDELSLNTEICYSHPETPVDDSCCGVSQCL